MDPWRLVIASLLPTIEQDPGGELPDVVQEAGISEQVFRRESLYLRMYLHHLMLGESGNKNVVDAFHASLAERPDYDPLRDRIEDYDRAFNSIPALDGVPPPLHQRMLQVGEAFARWCQSNDAGVKMWVGFYGKSVLDRLTHSTTTMVNELRAVLE